MMTSVMIIVILRCASLRYKRNHDDDDDVYNFNMHYNCDSDDDKIMNPRHNSGRDVHDNNVRNAGNIFVSFHTDDVVIL